MTDSSNILSVECVILKDVYLFKHHKVEFQPKIVDENGAMGDIVILTSKKSEEM